MSIETKKVLIMTFGAIGMMVVGAVGMWGLSNVMASPLPKHTSEIAPQKPIVMAISESTVTAPLIVTVPPKSTVTASPKPEKMLAQVLDVTPHYIVKRVAYRCCHQIPRTVIVRGYHRPTGAGAMIGGVAGGLIGHQFGHRGGNIAATIGGGLLGAVMGNFVEGGMHELQERTILVTVCKTKYMQKKIKKGYEITYFYNGEKRMKIMKRPPFSDKIAV